MNAPNAWHHSERVYIQAEDDDLVLVQYVDRRPVPGESMRDEQLGVGIYRSPIQPWAWLPRDDVMRFEELDAALLQVWKVA